MLLLMLRVLRVVAACTGAGALHRPGCCCLLLLEVVQLGLGAAQGLLEAGVLAAEVLDLPVELPGLGRGLAVLVVEHAHQFLEARQRHRVLAPLEVGRLLRCGDGAEAVGGDALGDGRG
ncbi:MAG: hypothetical protein U5N21_23555 [Rhodococcus sp. (in: high G+C Gram-positive bacteria)]|nr:hypothetical protein [Rhodococcus sp. (in: high G+C Gram-positive bacteria)]